MTELEDDEEVKVFFMVAVGDREALCLEIRVLRGYLRAGFFSPVLNTADAFLIFSECD